MTEQIRPRVLDLADRADIPVVLAELGLDEERPVLVSVGGAAGLAAEHLRALEQLLDTQLVPLLARLGALVVDGGTDSGVMRAMGRAVRGSDVPLLGVAAAGTVTVPGRAPSGPDAAELDPHHLAVLLVPGADWGAESPWIAAVAEAAAGAQPSATLVVNGGGITYQDAQRSVDAGRPLVVLAGTGRAADAIAAAARGEEADPRARAIVASGLVSVVPIADGAAAAAVIEALFASPGGR